MRSSSARSWPAARAYTSSQGARSLVREGGLFVARVPNGEFYAGLRSRLDGRGAALARALLAHNNLLAFPYRHGFTRGSLTRLLAATGWRVARIFGDALVPIADEWTRRWAAAEERAVKRMLSLAARARPASAPWLEVYARAE